MLSFFEMTQLIDQNRLQEAIEPEDVNRSPGALGHGVGRQTRKLSDPGHDVGRRAQDVSELRPDTVAYQRGTKDRGYAKDPREAPIEEVPNLGKYLANNKLPTAAAIHDIVIKMNPQVRYEVDQFVNLIRSKLGGMADENKVRTALGSLSHPPQGYKPLLKLTQDGRVEVLDHSTNDKEHLTSMNRGGGRYSSGMDNAKTANPAVGQKPTVTMDHLVKLNDMFNDRLMTLHDQGSPSFEKEAGEYIQKLFKLSNLQADPETHEMIDSEIDQWDSRIREFQQKQHALQGQMPSPQKAPAPSPAPAPAAPVAATPTMGPLASKIPPKPAATPGSPLARFMK